MYQGGKDANGSVWPSRGGFYYAGNLTLLLRLLLSRSSRESGVHEYSHLCLFEWVA